MITLKLILYIIKKSIIRNSKLGVLELALKIINPMINFVYYLKKAIMRISNLCVSKLNETFWEPKTIGDGKNIKSSNKISFLILKLVVLKFLFYFNFVVLFFRALFVIFRFIKLSLVKNLHLLFLILFRFISILIIFTKKILISIVIPIIEWFFQELIDRFAVLCLKLIIIFEKTLIKFLVRPLIKLLIKPLTKLLIRVLIKTSISLVFLTNKFILFLINLFAKLFLYLFIELSWKFFKKDFLHIKLDKITWSSFKQLYFLPLFLCNIFSIYLSKIKKYLYHVLYEVLVYHYILGWIMKASKERFYREGDNFQSKEEILERYHLIFIVWPKKFIVWFFGVYEIKFYILKYTSVFYRSYVSNFIAWHIKKYIFRPSFFLFLFLSKRLTNAFFFFFVIFLIIKFAKIIIFIIVVKLLKLKIFFMPVHVLFNYYRRVRRRITIFFRRSQLRIFRNLTLRWVFFFSKTYKQFFADCEFRFRYKFHIKGEVLIDYSYYDLLKFHLADNFLYKAIRRFFRRYYKRYRIYKLSIKFRSKFGLNGRWGIILVSVEKFFWFFAKLFFNYAYIITLVILHVIKKTFYYISIIIDFFSKK